MGSVGKSKPTHPDVGKEVTIKTGWMKGQWGIVKAVDEDETYHVSPYGGDEQLIFSRSDLRFSRKR